MGLGGKGGNRRGHRRAGGNVPVADDKPYQLNGEGQGKRGGGEVGLCRLNGIDDRVNMEDGHQA